MSQTRENVRTASAFVGACSQLASDLEALEHCAEQTCVLAPACPALASHCIPGDSSETRWMLWKLKLQKSCRRLSGDDTPHSFYSITSAVRSLQPMAAVITSVARAFSRDITTCQRWHRGILQLSGRLAKECSRVFASRTRRMSSCSSCDAPRSRRANCCESGLAIGLQMSAMMTGRRM